MLVRAIQSFVSPRGSAAAGEQLDLPPDQAVAWIRAGLVERVEMVETATRRTPEVAVTRRAK